MDCNPGCNPRIPTRPREEAIPRLNPSELSHHDLIDRFERSCRSPVGAGETEALRQELLQRMIHGTGA